MLLLRSRALCRWLRVGAWRGGRHGGLPHLHRCTRLHEAVGRGCRRGLLLPQSRKG